MSCVLALLAAAALGAGAPLVIEHVHVLPMTAGGATLERGPEDSEPAGRVAVFLDPSGHRWSVGHSIEEVTPAEMQRRYTALMKAPAS